MKLLIAISGKRNMNIIRRVFDIKGAPLVSSSHDQAGF